MGAGRGRDETAQEMIPDIDLRRAAQRDALDAYHWYEEQRPGLGEDFKTEVRECLSKIIENPRAFPVEHKFKGLEIRKARLKRFKPYSVIFEVTGNSSVIVYAIFHASRNPRVLERRLR